MIKAAGQVVSEAETSARSSNVLTDLPGNEARLEAVGGRSFADFSNRPSVLGSLASASFRSKVAAGHFVRTSDDFEEEHEQHMRESEDDDQTEDHMLEEALDQADKEIQEEQRKKQGEDAARAAIRSRLSTQATHAELVTPVDDPVSPDMPADMSVVQQLLFEDSCREISDSPSVKLLRSGSRPMRRSVDMGAAPTELSSVRFKDLGKVNKEDVGTPTPGSSPTTPGTPIAKDRVPDLERLSDQVHAEKVKHNSNVSKALSRMQTTKMISPDKGALASRKPKSAMSVSRSVKSWRGDGFWVCDPKNPKKVVWDMFAGALIVYSVTKIPYEMAFQPKTLDTIPVAIFDLFVDICFFIDMYLTFHTAYFEVGTNLLRSKKRDIRRNYMRSWFFPDLVSALPLSNRLIVGETESTNSFSAIKFIRLLRLVKLVRLVKLMRKSEFQEKDDTAKQSLMKLLALFGKIAFLAHVVACFWFMVSGCKSESEHEKTLQDEHYNLLRRQWPYESWQFCGGKEDQSKYVAAIYWSIATMMAVGYGDIYPRSSEAMVFAVMVQLIGAICFGFIIGAVADSIEASNREKKARRAKMNEIRDWTRSRGLTKKFRSEIIKHFEYSFARVTISDEADILSHLPHQLRLRVVLAGSMHRGIADGIEKSIRGLKDDSFLGELVTRLKPCKLYPMDYILETGDVVEQLYFIKTGKVKMSVLEDTVHHVMVGLFSAGTSMCLYEVLHKKLAMCSMLAVSTVEMWCLEAADFLALLRGRNAAVKHFERTALMQHSALMHSVESPTLVLDNSSRSKGLKIKSKIVVDGEITQHDHALARMNDPTHAMIMKSCTLQQQLSSASSTSGDSEVQSPSPLSPKNATPALAQSSGVVGSLFSADTSGRLRAGSQMISSVITSRLTIMGGSDAMSSGSLGADGHAMPILTQRLVPTDALTQHDLEESTITPYSDVLSLVEGYEPAANIWARGVINPLSSYKIAWDLFIGLAILTSVVQTPIMLGFKDELTEMPGLDEQLKGLDEIVMYLFFFDMVLNVVTAFENDAGVVVTPPVLIRRNYYKLWLWIDLASTVPWDQIPTGEGEQSSGSAGYTDDGVGNSTVSTTSSGSDELGVLRLLRVLRLFRLLKLVRLLKFAKLLGNLQKYIQDVDPIVIKFMTLCLTLLVVAHVFGCFWNSVSNMKNRFLQAEYGIDNFGEQYLACIYWAITTMTTVGYGDILPGKQCNVEGSMDCVMNKSSYEPNDTARIYASVIMLIGATIFGYIVGSASATVTDNSSSTAKEKLYLNQMHYYMDEQGVVSTLRNSIRSTMRFVLRKEGALFNEHAFYLGMPACLRNRVVTTFRAVDIEKMPVLQSLPTSFLGVIVQRMHASHTTAGSMVFMPYEGSSAIHFVLVGFLVQVKRAINPVSDALEHVYAFEEEPGSWLQPGDIFGHEELLGQDYLGVRASSLCSCYSLHFKDITLLARMYPDLARRFIHVLSARIVQQRRDFERRAFDSALRKGSLTPDDPRMEMSHTFGEPQPQKSGHGVFRHVFGKADAAAKAFGFELEYRKFLYTPLERPGGNGAELLAVPALESTPESTPKSLSTSPSFSQETSGVGAGEEKAMDSPETRARAKSEGPPPETKRRASLWVRGSSLSMSGDRDTTWPKKDTRVTPSVESDMPERRVSAPYKLKGAVGATIGLMAGGRDTTWPKKGKKGSIGPSLNPFTARRRGVRSRGSSLGLDRAKKSVFEEMDEKQTEAAIQQVESALLVKFRALPRKEMHLEGEAQMMLSPKGNVQPELRGQRDSRTGGKIGGSPIMGGSMGGNPPQMLSLDRKSFSADESVTVTSTPDSDGRLNRSLSRRSSSFVGVSEISGRPLYLDDGSGTATPTNLRRASSRGGSAFFGGSATEAKKPEGGFRGHRSVRRPSVNAADIVAEDIDEEVEERAALSISSAGVDVMEPNERAHGRDKSLAEVMHETARKGIGDTTARNSIIARDANRAQDRQNRSTL